MIFLYDVISLSDAMSCDKHIFSWVYLVVCNYLPVAAFHLDIELNVNIPPDGLHQQFFSHVGTFPVLNQY